MRDVVKGQRPDLIHVALVLAVLALGYLALSCNLGGWCPRRRELWPGEMENAEGGGDVGGGDEGGGGGG